MNYKEMIELAQSRGRGTEQAMHKSIDGISEISGLQLEIFFEGGSVLMTLLFFYATSLIPKTRKIHAILVKNPHFMSFDFRFFIIYFAQKKQQNLNQNENQCQ